MAYSTLIGDSQPASVKADAMALPMPLVTQVDVADADASINSKLLSGKVKGACAIMEETTGGALVIIVAEGEETTSDWRRQDNKVVITPS